MNTCLHHTILIKKVTCDHHLGVTTPSLGILGFGQTLKKLEEVPQFSGLCWGWRVTSVSPPAQGLQYMELIPKEKQPVTGTEGAYYRRRQLMHQLPIYDQDPSRCRGLLENELKLMEEFVKQYKSEALGVGEVALPGQGGLPKEEGKQQEKPEGTEPPAPTTNGSIGDPTKEYVSLPQAVQASSPHPCAHSCSQASSSDWYSFTLCLALSHGQ